MRLMVRRRPGVRTVGIAVHAQARFFRLLRRQGAPRRAALIGRLWRAALVDPKVQLVAVEEIISATTKRVRDTVLEFEKRDGATFGRPRRIEPRGLGAHAAQSPSPDQPHHVDLMRPLAEQYAAAERRIELFRPPRPVE